LGYACGNSNTDPMNTNGSKEWDRGRAKEDWEQSLKISCFSPFRESAVYGLACDVVTG
jgi:hypothetical protein